MDFTELFDCDISDMGSRKDLRLKLEACSTGEDSEDDQLHSSSMETQSTLAIAVTSLVACADFVYHSMSCLCLLQDTRTHVVVELYDTERTYVESLQTVVTVSISV